MKKCVRHSAVRAAPVVADLADKGARVVPVGAGRVVLAGLAAVGPVVRAEVNRAGRAGRGVDPAGRMGRRRKVDRVARATPRTSDMSSPRSCAIN